MIELQLQSLPKVFLLPPKFSPGSVPASAFFKRLPAKYDMPLAAASHGSESLLEWIERTTGRSGLRDQIAQALGPDAPGANLLQRVGRVWVKGGGPGSS